MTVLDLTASLGDILHTTGAELVGLGIGGRLMVATLVLSGEDAFVVRDDIILQFTHCLKLHTRHFGKGNGGLVECMLRR